MCVHKQLSRLAHQKGFSECRHCIGMSPTVIFEYIDMQCTLRSESLLTGQAQISRSHL
jgi:hypothetical protein